MEKEYNLRGRQYVQHPLVLGQIQELLPLIETVQFSGDVDAIAIVKTLGQSLNRALAIVLLEQGVDEPEPEKIKDAMERLEERSKQIVYSIEAEQTIEVIEDFFGCNRASSILEKLGKMIKTVRAQIPKASSILSRSSGDSPVATSPKGKRSSGA